MKRILFPVLLGAVTLAIPHAHAQGVTRICQQSVGANGSNNCTDVSSNNPLQITGPVTGTFSATLGGFTPSAAGARMTPLSVTTSDSSGNLPTGTVSVINNTDTTNPIYCNVNGVAATTADQKIPANSWFAFTIPAAVTTLHCIATGGTVTANGVGGAGLPTGAGGGGGSGSGSNASVSATGAAVPASATYIGITSAGNLVGWTGAVTQATAANLNATVVGTGTFATQSTVTQATASSLNATVVGAGSAGTANAGVVTVQGITSMTPIQVSQATAANLNATVVGTGTFASQVTGTVTANAGTNLNTSALATSANQPSNSAQAATTSGQTGNLIMGAVTTGAPSYTTAQTDPLSLDTAGNLRVNVVAGGGSGGTSAADAATWTAGTTAQTPIGCEFTTGGATALVTAHMGTAGCTTGRALFTDTSSVGGSALTAAVSALGTAATGTAVENVNTYIVGCVAGVCNANGSATSANSSPVVIASDQAAVAVKAASGAFASGALASGSVASGAIASGAIASGAAVSGAFVAGSIADLAHGQATMANSVPVVIASNQSTVPVSVAAITTGGASTAGAIVPNNTTAVVVKASAGTLYGVQLAGLGSAPAYLKIYNATSATCGSGTPVKRLMIPAAATAANGAGSNISFGSAGIAFGTGITYCVTTGIGDADTTAPAASTFLVNVDYD